MSAMDVTLKGNLGVYPEKIDAVTSTTLVKLRVAHSMRRKEASGEYSSETQWFTVKCFGQLGENALASLSKGDPVLVRGRIETESWTNQAGQGRTQVVIIASHVGIDLSTGIARFQRVRRDGEEAEAPASVTVMDTQVPYPDGEADLPEAV
ncbi:single-stranded DNA-binding protein [Bowdeniella nasicola]|nr:single-stranded DNA-binding protein [Bowdeniella nasicola]